MLNDKNVTIPRYIEILYISWSRVRVVSHCPETGTETERNKEKG